jgi:hypothetical protein
VTSVLIAQVIENVNMLNQLLKRWGFVDALNQLSKNVCYDKPKTTQHPFAANPLDSTSSAFLDPTAKPEHCKGSKSENKQINYYTSLTCLII